MPDPLEPSSDDPVPGGGAPRSTPPSSGQERFSDAPRWLVAIDTGGTFTDAIAVDPIGNIGRVKIPSDGTLRFAARGRRGGRRIELRVAGLPIRADSWLAGRTIHLPDEYRLLERVGDHIWELAEPLRLDVDGVARVDSGLDAPLMALHLLTGTELGEALPPLDLRLATTRATNALLERRGARTALLVSEGFGDLLEIGDQSRPSLFALTIRKRAPLVERSVEIRERRLADGCVRAALDQRTLRTLARSLVADGIEAVAVAFPHALLDSEHEVQAATILAEEGLPNAAQAARLSGSPRFISRAETAVVHASLTPILERYLRDVGRAIPLSRLAVLSSAGGLHRGDRFLARDALLSGPAGGVAGIADLGRRLGRTRLLGLDVGGTSADVARWDGTFTLREETIVGDARVAAPSLAIESVAAGGGSICRVHLGSLRVGPESAGADPGPACYGFGGPLTITDVLLLLGRIDPRRSSVPLLPAAAEAALREVLADLESARGAPVAPRAVLEALLALADERMAGAIAAVSLRSGIDPRRYDLVPFGGAGGLHACAIADRLGIERLLLPRDAGLLSARGLLGANFERLASRTLLEPFVAAAPRLADHVAALEREALEAVAADAGELPARVVERTIALRLLGQERSIEIPYVDERSLAGRFEEAFRHLYGYPPPPRALEIESIRVRAVAGLEPPPGAWTGDRRRSESSSPDAPATLPTWDRSHVAAGVSIEGPALLCDETSSAYIGIGWRARVLASGDIEVERSDPPATGSRVASVGRLEIFAARLEAIATAMGEQLRRTAFSANVKERLDYSCAILDAGGTLLSNAPHLPVHLGAMGICVRSVEAALGFEAGDVAVTNHPAFGGSHLPDVTVITPVFVDGARIAFVATRAHHAEIGGTRPGSFPPSARSLAEEGVVLPPLRVVERGRSRLDAVATLLGDPPHPSRSIAENLADLEAAIAANALGARELAAMAESGGRDAFAEDARALLDRTEAALRAALASVAAARYEALERLDDGTPIRVRVEVDRRAAKPIRIDFTGSGDVHPGNLNAPLAVVRAAVLYCLRLLVGEEIPLNEGLLAPVDLVVPPGFLNPPFDPDPRRCPPVAAGNTETSQRVVDALLRALGLVAGGQGTMNNLLFGDERYAMYETIAGGAGATRDAQGADAVHVHMTNTRITDVEVLERRAPVVVRRFGVRRGSGGPGLHRGGDGIVREIEFLRSTQVSILGQHRVEAPYGLEGGEPGALGRQAILRADGRREELAGMAEADCGPGDAIVVETPGGGGFGAVPQRTELADTSIRSIDRDRPDASSTSTKAPAIASPPAPTS